MLSVPNLVAFTEEIGYYTYLDPKRHEKMCRIDRRLTQQVELIIGSNCSGLSAHVLPIKFEGLLEVILGVLVKVYMDMDREGVALGLYEVRGGSEEGSEEGDLGDMPAVGEYHVGDD